MRVLAAANVSRLGWIAKLFTGFVVVTLAVIPCWAGTISFTDNFSSTNDLTNNYTQTNYTANTTCATGGACASWSVTQNASFGNPAPSVQFDVTWTQNNGFTIFDGLINNGFTYNPSTSGAITSLGFSLDSYVTFTSGTVVLSNASGRALLEQNGNFYLDVITGPTFSSATWQTVSATGLTASDFCLFSFSSNTEDCTQHPDFSSSGGLIDFGFMTGLGHSNTLGTGTFDKYSDNLSYTLTTVPEPSTAYLLIPALVGLPIRLRIARLRRK